jgi:hypothetical protein
MKNISREKEKFSLSAASVERVKAAAASIQTKYGITAAATGKDFERICEGEEIEVLRVLIRHKGYAFDLVNKTEKLNSKFIVFSTGKTHVSLRTKFYFIGALVIPAMFSLKKFYADEVSDREIKRKYEESELFARLMLKRGA